MTPQKVGKDMNGHFTKDDTHEKMPSIIKH